MLVVIGLLIGGVLVAQSMIETAKVGAQVRQFQQYDIAVTQFRNKYDQLPGDSSLFTPAGNNNGDIHGCGHYGGCVSFFGTPEESANFWKHLSDSGSISENYPTADYNHVTAGIDAPNAKLGKKGSLIQGMSLLNGCYGCGGAPVPAGNYWVLCLNGSTESSNRFCRDARYGAALTGVQALAMDTKMDDGVPLTGTVLAAGDAGGAPGGDYGIRCLAEDSSAYKLKITAPDWWDGRTTVCNLHVKMFSLAGGSQ